MWFVVHKWKAAIYGRFADFVLRAGRAPRAASQRGSVMTESLGLTSHKSTYTCTGYGVKKHFSGPVLIAKDLKEF
jgi:hypothetical protein